MFDDSFAKLVDNVNIESSRVYVQKTIKNVKM